MKIKKIFKDVFSKVSAIFGDLEYTLSDDGTFYTVTGRGSCKSENVVIKNLHNELPVIAIADGAFELCSRKSILIGDNVTTIGKDVFEYFFVENIFVGENNPVFKSIDGNLYSKDGKTLIKYTKSKKEESFTVPEGVTEIGEWAFRYSEYLTSIHLSDSVTAIGEEAFINCENVTTVTFGAGVTSFARSAFYICYHLENILVDEKNPVYQSIDGNMYSKDGKTFIRYPEGKTATSFTIPDGVTVIDESAFAECSNLKSIQLPDGITKIGDRAFEDCRNLESIQLPDSVTSIGEEAFISCRGLTSVYYKGTMQEWENIRIGSDNDDLTSATRYYYSETPPTADGNYWHYDEKGEISVW